MNKDKPIVVADDSGGLAKPDNAKGAHTTKPLTLVELLNEMGGIGDPFALFEPYLWRDKLGDSLWHCEIESVCITMWKGDGDTPLEAAQACYDNAMASATDLATTDLADSTDVTNPQWKYDLNKEAERLGLPTPPTPNREVS